MGRRSHVCARLDPAFQHANGAGGWVRLVLTGILAAIAGCGGGESDSRVSQSSDAGGEPSRAVDDTDRDGLCDITEWDFGTNPDRADSDGDGLPDLIELGNGFGPLERSAPATDQIGELSAERGASLDFPVRVTVDGDGRAVSGFFIDIPSLYLDGSSAADFFAGATAVSADPIDGPRRVNADAAEFVAVLGTTRLLFNLRFEYRVPGGSDETEPSCQRAYPFRYAIKASDGEDLAERLYLLRVGAGASSAIPYCLPTDCH